MTFKETKLDGAWLIKPVRYGDARGYFSETFRKDEFESHIGKVDFVQDNESRSRYGVVRGLHYQAGKASQAKLVRVTEGTVIDFAVDLRTASPTFGQWIAVELSADNGLQLFIPRGFAHGFAVVSPTATFQYKVDNFYSPADERCIRFDDPQLSVEVPLSRSEMIFSEKDLSGVSFSEAEKF